MIELEQSVVETSIQGQTNFFNSTINGLALANQNISGLVVSILTAKIN
jgi:hypothetical protein